MPAMERVPRNRLPWLVLAGLLAVGIAVPMTGSELGLGGFAESGASASPSAVSQASSSGPVASPTVAPTSTPSASSPSSEPASSPSTSSRP